jgi:succinylarginine dihydrolase
MATAVSAPNLQRYALPEIEIDRDPMGIISIMEDLVERVMTAHTKKSASFDADLRNMNREPEDELVSLLALHSVYDFADGQETAA